MTRGYILNPQKVHEDVQDILCINHWTQWLSLSNYCIESKHKTRWRGNLNPLEQDKNDNEMKV